MASFPPPRSLQEKFEKQLQREALRRIPTPELRVRAMTFRRRAKELQCKDSKKYPLDMKEEAVDYLHAREKQGADHIEVAYELALDRYTLGRWEERIGPNLRTLSPNHQRLIATANAFGRSATDGDVEGCQALVDGLLRAAIDLYRTGQGERPARWHGGRTAADYIATRARDSQQACLKNGESRSQTPKRDSRSTTQT